MCTLPCRQHPPCSSTRCLNRTKQSTVTTVAFRLLHHTQRHTYTIIVFTLDHFLVLELVDNLLAVSHRGRGVKVSVMFEQLCVHSRGVHTVCCC